MLTSVSLKHTSIRWVCCKKNICKKVKTPRLWHRRRRRYHRRPHSYETTTTRQISRPHFLRHLWRIAKQTIFPRLCSKIFRGTAFETHVTFESDHRLPHKIISNAASSWRPFQGLKQCLGCLAKHSVFLALYRWQSSRIIKNTYVRWMPHRWLQSWHCKFKLGTAFWIYVAARG